jgi:hypothetical protein
MTDSLRETLEAVTEQAEANPDLPLQPIEEKPAETSTVEKTSEGSEGSQATPVAKGPPQPEREGSEAPKTDDQGKATPAVGRAKPAGQAEVGKEPKEHITNRAPSSWTNEAREGWNTVPLPIRQEILKREKEVTDVLGQSASARQLMENLHNVVAPHMPRIQANRIHPLDTIKNLLEADNLLATADQPRRAGFLAKIIKDYGIDVEELDKALAGQLQGRGNPNQEIAQAVQQAIGPLLTPIQNWQREQAANALREQEEASKIVQRMELDPKYEFFGEVRDYMADIMDIYTKRGLAISPEEAYNKAIQTHPEISRVVQERTEQEAAKTALSRGTEAARKARIAGSSVGSSAPLGGSPSGNGSMSLRDTIEAAFTAAGDGGRI